MQRFVPTWLCFRTWRTGVIAAVVYAAANLAHGTVLELKIKPTWSGEPLQTATLRYQNAAGERLSVTRASYLLTGFALQRPDKSWLELTNHYAWFDAERERHSARLEKIPADVYRAIRFHIGPDAHDNHTDVAKFSAEHPLNPNLNNLHWSWQGGYIFLALEGMWRSPGGGYRGWSYHLARDPNRTRIELNEIIDLTRDAVLHLDFDIARLLSPISFNREGTSTHSREGDVIATSLVTNLPGAFRFRNADAVAAPTLPKTDPKPLHLPAQFTPFRFQMSSAFPLPDLPRDNPLIEERVALGEKLFHETALSKDGSLSCASCHLPEKAFSDSHRFSVGVRNEIGKRNAMPLFNLAWRQEFFWDGRAPSLRAQVVMPIEDHAEMDESITNVVAKLSADARYREWFAAAFEPPEITDDKIALALEQFLLTLTSHDSKFDRAMRGDGALTTVEQRGFELFMTEFDPRTGSYGADCFHCHGGPLFQSQSFANNGLDSAFADLGRSIATAKESDKGRFAVPSLRNVAVTAPYMHDGRFSTLEEVIEHYSSGVKPSVTLDPNLAKHPVGGVPLSAEDKRALVQFLQTLTDAKFQR